MAPVKFADLGKGAKDLLTKDYAYGEVKVEVNTRAENGTEFKKIISRPNGKGVAGSAEIKYAYTPNRISITEKWLTSNILMQTVTLDGLMDGLKVDVDSSYNLQSSNFTTVVKADHIREKVRTNVDVDILKQTGCASVVVAHEGVNLGVQGAYDAQKGVLTQQNLAIAYDARDFTLTAITNGTKVDTFLHHRVSTRAQAAAQFSANPASNATAFTLGGHYALDKDAYIRAKASMNGDAAIAYTQALRPGVKLTLGMNLDTQNLQTDAHKLGLALTINA